MVVSELKSCIADHLLEQEDAHVPKGGGLHEYFAEVPNCWESKPPHIPSCQSVRSPRLAVSAVKLCPPFLSEALFDALPGGFHLLHALLEDSGYSNNVHPSCPRRQAVRGCGRGGRCDSGTLEPDCSCVELGLDLGDVPPLLERQPLCLARQLRLCSALGAL